jgi:ubiquinone/menaquinone biosynthesis C-methylase UbiE
MQNEDKNLGWGRVENSDVEIWDTKPVFLDARVTNKDWLKLLFYPKKWFLYRHIKKAFDNEMKDRSVSEPFRILDIGCGTGATLVDLKKMFGRRADVVGVDVVRLQIDIAKEKIKKYGVNAEADWYDGTQLPFSNNNFDAVYTSDVLGHVKNVPQWLEEIKRVLKSGGTLAMFNESKLGKHAFVRNYLFNRGLNVDPHSESHISLYSKLELKNLIQDKGFEIEKMLGVFWASFLVHPDEFYPKLNGKGQRRFFVLKAINRILTFLKKKTHPYSTAAGELYGLGEAYLIGRWVEAQGYVVLGKKKG